VLVQAAVAAEKVKEKVKVATSGNASQAIHAHYQLCTGLGNRHSYHQIAL